MTSREAEIRKLLIEHGILPYQALVTAIGAMVDDAFIEGMDTEYGAWVARVGLKWLTDG